MLTSRRINGNTALTYGLVDHAWPDEEFDSRLDALTAEIVANSWGTNRRVKRLLGLAANSPRGAALALERTRPWGLPEDSAERRAKGVKR
jgi:enoyl-CoA hydratase/carnithine racemase